MPVLWQSGRAVGIGELQEALRQHNENQTNDAREAYTFFCDDNGIPLVLAAHFEGHAQIAFVQLAYDGHQALQVRLDRRIQQGPLTQLDPSWFNPALGFCQRRTIAQIARAIEGGAHYSLGASVLSLCRSLRKSEQRGEPIDFAQALAFFSVHGDEVLAAYQSGSCLNLAQAIRDRVRRRLGVRAYVVAVQGDNNVVAWRPLIGRGEHTNRQAADFLQQTTHTDVVVPYLCGDQRRYVYIVCGVGVNFCFGGGRDAPLRHINDLSENDPSPSAGMRRWWLDRADLLANPERLAADAIRCTPTLLFTHRDKTSQFAIDMVRAQVLLTTKSLDVGARSDRASFVGPKMASFDAVEQIAPLLVAAQDLFGFDDETIDDIGFLLRHRNEWVRSILVAPAAAQAAAHDAHTRAARALQQRIAEPLDAASDGQKRPTQRLVQDMQKAIKACEPLDPVGAQALFEAIEDEASADAPNAAGRVPDASACANAGRDLEWRHRLTQAAAQAKIALHTYDDAHHFVREGLIDVPTVAMCPEMEWIMLPDQR